jgi:crotonobetainyl-CoA:carnitine CoA-transferase CaiB-like acyl-CoA transferase
MLECMVEWMGFPMYYAFNGEPGPVPAGASHASIYPYGPFETGDGQSVMLGIQNEREWANFCAQVLSQPDLATDPRFSNNSLRTQNREALKDIICTAFAPITAEEATRRLDQAAIANANVNDMHGVWEHAQLRARNRWTEVQTSSGPVPALLPPGFSASDNEGFNAQMDPVPKVGEHNESILAELGISKRPGHGKEEPSV